jgi:hypothetical protein
MSAIISPCGQYRYRLERTVAQAGPVYAFFGINPSTADASVDDATVRKWIGFTKAWGGSRFIVGNVSPYRSTDVQALASHPHTIEVIRDNANHIMTIAGQADVLVPCWGNRTKLPSHLRHLPDCLLQAFWASGKPVKHLGLTKSGDPKHPLMLGYATPLQDWVRPES